MSQLTDSQFNQVTYLFTILGRNPGMDIRGAIIESIKFANDSEVPWKYADLERCMRLYANKDSINTIK